MSDGQPVKTVRVIVVGRTRLDGTLRVDEGVELLRVNTPVDAVAEASDPIDDETPGDLSVVVGADIDLDGHTGSFVNAIRLVHPDARIFGVAGQSAELPDGWLDPDGPGDNLRARVRGEPLPSHDAPAEDPGSAELVETLLRDLGGGDAQPAQPISRTIEDDTEVITAMTRGLDPTPILLGMLRRQTGAHDTVIVATQPTDGPAHPLRFGDRTLGWLRSDHLDAAAIETAGPWLAGWLALHAQQKQLKQAAFKDDLTEAWNRRYFRHFLDATIRDASANRRSVTLLFFDIDDFKTYNDSFGHAAGDEILSETVRLMLSMVRPTDRVCRVGGDEFAVVFYDPGPKRDPDSTPPNAIGIIATRFQRAICEHKFPKLADAPGTLTISGGLATYPWDGRSPDELLERADQLSIQSKRQGKNAITLGPGAKKVCGISVP